MSTSPVRWGFLGAGYIATEALAPAVHAAAGAELVAVAARDRDRAERLEPHRAYDRYEHVLDDDRVDAVYIALTNEAHLSWIVAALEAGKDVLCEKPLTLDGRECRQAVSAAERTGRLLVEATWVRWHPRYRRADQLMRSSGPIRTGAATFTFDGVPPDNYRLDATRGGGALLDLGPYLVAPLVDWCPLPWATVTVHRDVSAAGVDLTTDAVLTSERTEVSLHASFVEPERQSLRLSTGALSLEWIGEPFTSWRASTSLAMTDGTRSWREDFAPCDAYQMMVEEVSRAVRGDQAAHLPGLTPSVATADLIDRIAAA